MSEGAREAGSLTVFISYSRDDLDFADQLDAALKIYKYEVALDRHGISGGEDWQTRLGALIRGADTVVFVLSPASAGSAVCQWEVSEAVRLGKRIIPVTCRPLQDAHPPPQLAALNYIFFYAEPRASGSGFGTGLAQLVTALNTDLDWLREHTRLLQRATEWEEAGRAESRLLFGDSIAGAKAWAARRPKEAPEPTALHYDYIRASEEAETRRQDADRQQLERMAEAQDDRAQALAEREIAQEREAEQARKVVRRTVTGLVVAILFAAAAGGTGFLAFQKQREAAVERDRARFALAQILAERSWDSLASGARDVAIRYAVAGWRVAPTHAAHYRAPLAQAMASPVIPTLLRLHQGRITTLASSPDRKHVVSGGKDGLVQLLDMASLSIVHTFKPMRGLYPVTAAGFDPSGTRVVTVTMDGSIQLWEITLGLERMTVTPGNKQVNAAIFSPDARRLVTTSDNEGTLWELPTGQLITTIRIRGDEGFSAGRSAVAFSADGQRFVTGGRDGSAILWDATTGVELRTLREHSGEVTTVAFSMDGRFLLTGADDKAVLVWDLRAENTKPQKLVGHLSGIRAVTLSPDSSQMYVVDFSGNAYIWDMQTSRIIVASTSGAQDDGLASFSDHGTYAAITERGGELRVWDARAAHTLLTLRENKSPGVSAILWSEQRLVVGDESGMLSVFDLRELTQSMSDLAARACAKERALSPQFTWMESAADPLIKEVWDQEGTVRSVCE
jgi:WD40 repeat protein